ncbi:RNA polymerase sigma factor [Streptomyces sp. NPDC014983]|uniref:RNA polymerase sigma factor n=1 Tax=Streptomyces sp. NPDC014983 TaxID=3364933 RepID=UPI0036F7DA39
MDGSVATATQQLRAELPLDLEMPYEAFMRQQREPYYRYAYSKLASQTEAREAVNDFFVKLHLRWQEVLRSDNLAGFAWKMLHDHIVDVLRRRDRRPTPVDTAFLPGASSLWSVDSDPLDALLTRIDLYRALAELPERQRTCFWLRHVLGYSAVEIADITGISASTIRTHLQHATRQLARALQPHDNWSVPAPRKAS